MLSAAQIDQFISDGFLRLDDAFPRDVADAGRAILWKAAQVDPDTPASWTQPVIRIPSLSLPFFLDAAHSPRLAQACDDLVGAGRWQPLQALGGFVIRFRSESDPGDGGWHVDASFLPDGKTPDPARGYLDYHVNHASRGRALLMLFLFSDVTEADAPTIISVGSHRRLSRRLTAMGADGASVIDLAQSGAFDADTAGLKLAYATGPAGTVYLCHPHLIHRAQTMSAPGRPRLLAQPALLPADGVTFDPVAGTTPLERAMRF